jgi:hypothetical protein
MNDMILFASIFGCVMACLVAFAGFHIYRGVHGSLADAQVGEVYNFEYLQPHHGDPVRVLARVIEPVYTLTDDRIRRLNVSSNYRSNDPQFKRTRHLVTCETPNGEVRQFYAERARNIRKPLLAGLLFRTGTAHLFA